MADINPDIPAPSNQSLLQAIANSLTKAASERYLLLATRLQTEEIENAQSGTTSNSKHETALTQFVEANGVRYAYRRFGKARTVPLLLREYFNSSDM